MKKTVKMFAVCTLLVGLMASCAMDSPRIKGYMGVIPEDYGLSSQKLYQISENLRNDVNNDVVPGAVALIAQKKKIVYLENFGMQVKNKEIPMSRDSIFRIASMSKPITSVAALILHEQGKLNINDPVSKYLPEFRNMKVGIEGDDGIEYTEPVKREMTIKDLMMHTSGLTYGIFGVSTIKKMYLDSQINSKNQPLHTMTRRLGKIPLVFHPGTKWEYSRSTDVLGRVIEVASGTRLDMFLEKRIFRPLGMKDTGFSVKRKDIGRLAEAADDELSDVSRKPVKLFAGEGLVSTVSDYYQFTQMLLNRGALNGKQILKKETVKLMTRDHLNGITGDMYLPDKGYGFGLGVAVRTEKKAWKEGTIGDYWWGGMYGTYFWIDPEKDLIAIIMTQSPERRMYYRTLYREWVYDALKD